MFSIIFPTCSYASISMVMSLLFPVALSGCLIKDSLRNCFLTSFIFGSLLLPFGNPRTSKSFWISEFIILSLSFGRCEETRVL